MVMITERILKDAGMSVSYQLTELQRKVSVLIVISNFGIWDLFSNTMRKVEQLSMCH